MEWIKSTIFATAVISTIIILSIVIVMPKEPPRVQEEDIGIVTPGVNLTEEMPTLFWNAFNFSKGESYTYKSTFPDQIGKYTIEIKDIVGRNYTVRVYGKLNESFDSTVTLPRIGFFLKMAEDKNLSIVGLINNIFLDNARLYAFSRLNLSEGSNYTFYWPGPTIFLKVTGTSSVKGFDCYLVEAYTFNYKDFEYCVNPDMGLPLRVRHYSPLDKSVDYVISLTNYTKI